MSSLRRLAVAVAALSAAVVAVSATPAMTTTNPAGAATAPGWTRSQAAARATAWLASRFNDQGFIPAGAGSSQPDLSATAQAVLALAADNAYLPTARKGLAYLAAHMSAYVPDEGSPGPAQIAQLILDAVALGDDPTDFGHADLVSLLEATEQSSGGDRGLFGTEAQLAGYATGTYQQGLALAALAAAGVRSGSQVQAGVGWLQLQQCPDGGWTSPDQALNGCSGSPASFAGPDTNSTSLAIEGLAAQGSLGSASSRLAYSFLQSAMDADGGWSYFPNTTATPGVTDPDSTSLVIQALVSLRRPAGTAAFSRLQTFQLTSGADAGAFYFPPAPSPANVVATYQALPALVSLAVPFGPLGGYWLAESDGSVLSFGSAVPYGSAASDHPARPIVAIVATPDGRGYWQLGSDGGVFAFGSARYEGSLPGIGVHASDIVAMAPAPDGRGYWIAGGDGGVFAFGSARYEGSMPALHLHVADVTGISGTPSGDGYFLAARDGAVYRFGDAPPLGSPVSLGLHVMDLVAITGATPPGGYWLAGADGGVFSFGTARYHGSMGGHRLAAPVTGLTAAPGFAGYYEVAEDGGVFAFGAARFWGSAAGSLSASQRVVGIAASPAGLPR